MTRIKQFYIMLFIFILLAIGGAIVPTDNYIYTTVEFFAGILLWIAFHRWWWKKHTDFIKGIKSDMARSEKEFHDFCDKNPTFFN